MAAATPSPFFSLLVINPNSTTVMTDALKPIVTPLLPPNVTATFFTGPPTSPPSINDMATSHTSTTACLPHLLPLLPSHTAILIACYSPHPLIPILRALTPVPVAGIFEASLYHALALGGRFGIVTTGFVWEGLLTDGVEEVLGGLGRLVGVESTGLDADQLHVVEKAEVERRVEAAARRLVKGGAGVICLGCAGMVGMREVVVRGVGDGVRVVDGVEAGVGVLAGMVGRGY